MLLMLTIKDNDMGGSEANRNEKTMSRISQNRS